jgi:hypothetical protein
LVGKYWKKMTKTYLFLLLWLKKHCILFSFLFKHYTKCLCTPLLFVCLGTKSKFANFNKRCGPQMQWRQKFLITHNCSSRRQIKCFGLTHHYLCVRRYLLRREMAVIITRGSSYGTEAIGPVVGVSLSLSFTLI